MADTDTNGAKQGDPSPASERIEVTLGPEVGIKVFEGFEDVAKWVGEERQYWGFLANQIHAGRDHSTIWERFQSCYAQVSNILGEIKSAEAEAQRAASEAENPRYSDHDRDRFRQRASVDYSRYRENLKATFRRHYQELQLLSRTSARAKFLASLAESESPVSALFACGYFLRVPIEFGAPERLQGALLASFYEHGFVKQKAARKESLTEFYAEWQKQFQADHDAAMAELELHKRHNANVAAQIQAQKDEFVSLVATEKENWAALHKAYDETLALQAPVMYWRRKAVAHRWLAAAYGVGVLAVGAAAVICLYRWLQLTLGSPPSLTDPAKWHPEYWRIGMLLAAGVFAVWGVRIAVRLFLSHIHLLADANERTTMVQTYLALQRSEGGLEKDDRTLILQALFRPASTGVVKDDGVPLAWVEAITKLGKT